MSISKRKPFFLIIATTLAIGAILLIVNRHQPPNLLSFPTLPDTNMTEDEFSAYLQKNRVSNTQFLSILEREITSFDNKTNATKDMLFGGYLSYASGPFSRHYLTDKRYLNMSLEEIAVLDEAGVNLIEIYIEPETWQIKELKDFFDKTVEEIKKRKIKLLIGYSGMHANDTEFPHEHISYETLEDYRQHQNKTIKEFTERYKPEYVSVVVEPMTRERWGNISITDEEWVELVSEAAKIVKNANPKAKTIATVTPLELSLLEKFASLPSIDILGINPYRESLFYREVVKKIDELVKQKPVYFTETWISGSPTDFASSDLEADFLNFVLNFSQEHDILGLCPFFSKKFFSESNDLTQQYEDLLNKKRTPVFWTYKEFIEN